MKPIRQIIFTITLLFAATHVAALPITVGGVDYNIGTITGTVSTHLALLESQDWYNDIPLAAALSQAFGDSLGLHPGYDGSGIYQVSAHMGPAFVTFISDNSSWGGPSYAGGYIYDPTYTLSPFPTTRIINLDTSFTFAVATPATVPEPPIIALFAAGLFGIGFARRRRS